jgi:predicted nucleotidyltransferase
MEPTVKSKEPSTILQENRKILEDHQVKSLYLFGSIVRGENKPGSDIDILVEFQPVARVGLFGMAGSCSTIRSLGRASRKEKD